MSLRGIAAARSDRRLHPWCNIRGIQCIGAGHKPNKGKRFIPRITRVINILHHLCRWQRLSRDRDS
ncbi:hypothetical protein EPYR_03531 [Erwinia pyrifoliae DSM 12163]|nr:hypothetical protein EPYR_03531 [Erwinia pyrifoliae DSM 12163]